ncbi:MAG: hypothetical protein HN981_02760 [Candidatus Pacebacteria bacterium]|jgi:hypothetical protein|nr:hypothetical protein [Candidatus Paceibacterota bacterium]MBT4652588.1 hypothetical protein [Candidatus Paceibacterota bacterium]MBT6756415.1 hypothetical protein [Candidatus Paceibacterota bacterium]MBT6921291.1 hypothetical protein [Candidatus Paceibacterota bacterium]
MNKYLKITPPEIKRAIYDSFQNKKEGFLQQDLIELMKEEFPILLTIMATQLDKLETILENFFERKNGKI